MASSSPITLGNDGAGLDKADAREILELRAKEVSLVDRPAILRQFLVVKRQQQQEATMGAFDATGGSQPVPIEKMIESMNWGEVDVEKALPIDLQNAIKAVIAYTKKPEGKFPQDEADRVSAFLGKVASGKYPYPSPQGKEKGAGKESLDPKAGEKGATKAVEKCPKCDAEMKDGVCPECGYEAKSKGEADKGCGTKTKKNMDGGLTISISPDGDLEISGDKVAKGLKGFTSERSKTLAEVVKSLLTLMAEVDSETTKSIIDDLAKGLLPADIKWTSGTEALPAVAQKNLSELVTGAIASALEPVAKRLGEVSAQVESITKSRTAPNSEGGNRTDTIHKGNGKGFWDGVPLR
jgi:hypothetical protein